MELLYQGSRGGWKTKDFHAKCKNKGATITVIWSSDGLIFGAFADKTWTSFRVYCKSNKAFLFSLDIPSSEVEPPKVRKNQDTCSYAMLDYSSYGPSSGWFCRSYFHISNGTNNNSNSSSYPGNTYQISLGKTDTFLVGSIQIKVSYIEVFQIILQLIF